MPSHTTTRYSEKGVSVKAYCAEIERDVANQQIATRTALRAAAEPVVAYPESLDLLQRQGRPKEDLHKLGVLVQSIARDVDHFSAEERKLAEEFEDLKAKRPNHKGRLANHNARAVQVGMRYIDLNERILGTVNKTVEDLTEIIGGEIPANQSAPDAEAQS